MKPLKERADNLGINARYFVERTIGLTYASNSGVRAASAPYVALIDDDEYAHSDWLQHLHATASENGADVVCWPVGPVFGQSALAEPLSRCRDHVYDKCCQTLAAVPKRVFRFAHGKLQTLVSACRTGDKEYQIGRHQIVLPRGHTLDHFRSRWQRYDQTLEDIAFIVHEKYPDATVIDVGANVGDTAAVICARQDLPVLAIEGNSRFIPYLRENARRLGPHVEVLECFVGPPEYGIDLSLIDTRPGTSSAVPAIKDDHATGEPPIHDSSGTPDDKT